MAERVRVREISNGEGNRLLRIVPRSSGSVVTWRRAQMVLLSVQGMGVPGIARVSFMFEDRVRTVIHNFNTDGFARRSELDDPPLHQMAQPQRPRPDTPPNRQPRKRCLTRIRGGFR